jgi:acetylornithine deacetylase/succinyl-diaminopimelate desuccinylase-like protein
MVIKKVYAYIDQHSQDFLKDLATLVQQPSVSAKGEGIEECAEMTKKMLEDIGFSTQLIPEKGGSPVVYAERTSERSRRTLLFYDHYDVQPPEPLEEWELDPFSGMICEGRIYGRGVSDNKGNLVSRIKAVEAFLKTEKDVPVNVKFVVEGEEEIGSPHFEVIVKEHADLFSNDATIWEFGGTNYAGQPEIYLGLKGILSVELRTAGALRDVHSASAPLVPNPAWRLVWALNSLKDEEERILVDAFHERVLEPSKEEIRFLNDIPFEEEEEMRSLGLKEFLKKRTGYEAKKALFYEPTCTINGIITGYTESGSKTVLPMRAMAKLDFRLVPNQMPDEILEKLVKHLRDRGFHKVEVVKHGSTEPARTPINEGFVDTVVEAAQEVYEQKAVVYPTSAASGPMHLFRNWLGCPVVSVGCGHREARAHAPNENLTVDGFVRGTKLIAAIMSNFGRD